MKQPYFQPSSVPMRPLLSVLVNRTFTPIRLRRLAILAIFVIGFICALVPSAVAFAESDPEKGYFSLSTSQTYAPEDAALFHVRMVNESALEFRVYRINDPAAFFHKLEDAHQFGREPLRSYQESIDERTWLERFHDWKHEFWISIRDFFREQFSWETRQQLRAKLGGKPRPGVASFAQVPVINSRQLVARWHISIATQEWNESVKLPLEKPESGVYAIEATDGASKAYTIVILSHTAMVVKSAPGQVVTFLADRKTGAPVVGAKLSLWAAKLPALEFTSDASGLIEAALKQLKLPKSDKLNDIRLVAVSGKDVAVMTPTQYSLASHPGENWASYIYTDRPVYRPGHTVEFRAILRDRQGNRYRVPGGQQVQVAIDDPQNKTVLQKQMTLSQFGSLHGEFQVPANAALGYYSVRVVYPNGTTSSSGADEGGEGGGYRPQGSGGFYVEEYKKPEYVVTVKPEKQRIIQGETIKATIEARYFFGEPVTNAKVTYTVHTYPYWSPYLDASDADSDAPGGGEASADATTDDTTDDSYSDYGGNQTDEQTGQLDATGHLTVTVPTKASSKKQDMRYRIEAKVMDAANREISGVNSVVTTFGSFEVSVRGDQYFVSQGKSVKFTVQAKDYDGKPVQTAAKLEISRWDSPTKMRAITQTAEVTTGADGSGQATVTFPDAGSFTVSVRTITPTPFGPRPVESSSYLYVTSEKQNWWSGDSRQVRIIPDKKKYVAGDTAHLLVMTGVPEAWLLVTTEGRSVTTKQVIHITGVSGSVDVPILAEHEPGVAMTVAFLHGSELYQGEKMLSVPAAESVLQVDVSPSKLQFQPGEAGLYTITAKDSHGKPVQGEFSLGVVDEAIYSVRPDQSGSMVDAFYSASWNRVNTDSSMNYYFSGSAGNKTLELARAGLPVVPFYRPKALADLKSEQLIQPKVRKAFPDTALWRADIRTDARGQAQVKLNFPDALTQWRATVRGITLDSKVGAGVSKVIVRKNLLVRIAAPRFFRQGDEVVLSAIVHNYLESAKNVQISMDLTGLDVISGSTQKVNVPSRGETKVDWRVRAGTVREAKLLAKALTNEESDAMEITLPVTLYGVKQAMSQSGSLADAKGSADLTLMFPPGTEVSGHSMGVTLSPSVGGVVLGALPFLTSYPYGCTEQTMSSFLPNIIVARAMQDLKVTNGVDAGELTKKVKAGLDRLYDYQHDDGGWGWWKEDESLVYMTAYVVEGLTEANAAGFEVEPARIAKAKTWLKSTMEKHPSMKPELRAYVVYALTRAGERNPQMYDKVWERRRDLSATGLAYAGMAMRLAADARASEAATMLEKSATQNDSEAWWPSTRDDLMEFDTEDSVESTAYALRLISLMKPDSAVAPKAALWLVNHRDQGYWWSSTKQTAMAIFGLTEYLRHSHELDADLNAEVWLNGREVSAKHFTRADALSGTNLLVHLDYKQLLSGANQLRVQRSGRGRLYWSARAEYYSTDKRNFQKNQLALNITRDYFALVPQEKEDPDGKRITYKLQPFSGTAAPGQVLAVHVTVGGTDWNYTMAEDPIPAGAEFVEKDGTYEIDGRPSWWSYWFTRREFHDDRANLFQTYLYERHKEYFYLIKMVNPGKYRVSPAIVQPMYEPDVMATSDALTVEVK